MKKCSLRGQKIIYQTITRFLWVFKWIYFILPLVLFFPLFQLGQNTRWGSSACLSPCRSQWWNGRCRNPKYWPHQRLPNFGEEKRKLMILTSSQWIIFDRVCISAAESLLGSLHPRQSRHSCSQGWSWLLIAPAPNPTTVTLSKHCIDLRRELEQKPNIFSYWEWQLTRPGGLRPTVLGTWRDSTCA